MAGHSKWKQIKHRKAATDSKRSQLFGKLARYLVAESKKAGGDVLSQGLRTALEKARAANMPGENIERAIQKGKTETGTAMASVIYESYGEGGVALIIDGLTDNRNRTAAELRHLLAKNGATWAQPGAASWAFAKQPDGTWEAQTSVALSERDLQVLESLVEALEAHDDVQAVYVNAQ